MLIQIFESVDLVFQESVMIRKGRDAMMDVKNMHPEKFRKAVGKGSWTKPTAGVAPGYAQANLVILPKSAALDFMIFAQRNPKACPVIDVLEAGVTQAPSAKGSDIRRDIPRYRIYEKGKGHREVSSIEELWREDFVSFLLGCSFTFESELIKQGIPMKHIDLGKNVSMYQTNIPCKPAGRLSGDMVVSMRPIKSHQIAKAVEISARYPEVHGSPIHIGNPEAIGIKSLNHPDYGEAVPMEEDEIPVFWPCGVTPQSVLMNSGVDFFITHAPGHMFVTDIKNEELGR